ncbi:TetR/AcrR family transcriptional regulator [Nocardioides jensenii]|uniref:TetR/AcrR family transcriptional regulator n=1 Tax=Nocardioides jensenii TaxID=1843 RepID=UPI00082C4C7C|nr:TetR/AcrR family transcriptional regulator [Nocardioides jensenii]
MAPRPRSVDDDVILDATRAVVGELGPDRLTLAEVGRRVGLTAGALVQRFGSKRGLLLASAARSTVMVRRGFAEAEAVTQSPLAALEEVATASLAHIERPEEIGHGLGFVRLDVVDPDFRALAQDHSRAVADGTRGLLDKAVRAGELRPETDTGALSLALLIAFHGTPVVWALRGEGRLDDFARDQLRQVLAPHLI